jgi:hypothetical protein
VVVVLITFSCPSLKVSPGTAASATVATLSTRASMTPTPMASAVALPIHTAFFTAVCICSRSFLYPTSAYSFLVARFPALPSRGERRASARASFTYTPTTSLLLISEKFTYPSVFAFTLFCRLPRRSRRRSCSLARGRPPPSRIGAPRARENRRTSPGPPKTAPATNAVPPNIVRVPKIRSRLAVAASSSNGLPLPAKVGLAMLGHLSISGI